MTLYEIIISMVWAVRSPRISQVVAVSDCCVRSCRPDYRLLIGSGPGFRAWISIPSVNITLGILHGHQPSRLVTRPIPGLDNPCLINRARLAWYGSRHCLLVDVNISKLGGIRIEDIEWICNEGERVGASIVACRYSSCTVRSN